MKITRDNYESFFIDFIEGNLPENMIDQFLDFLNQNPDLKEELHLFEEVNLPEELVVFQEKKQLHKSAADENRRGSKTRLWLIWKAIWMPTKTKHLKLILPAILN